MPSKLDLLLWTQQYKTNSFHTFYKHFYIYIPCYHSGCSLPLQSQAHENHDFRISRFWSVQKALLTGATRTVPNGPSFRRRSLRSVLQMVLYSLPAIALPGTPSPHRTDPRERENHDISCCPKKSMLETQGLSLTVQNSERRLFSLFYERV